MYLPSLSRNPKLIRLPSWVTAGNFSKPELTSIIKAHIVGVAGHYKGIPYTWDVVNEVFNVRTYLYMPLSNALTFCIGRWYLA
jgi:hypothetical protein